jgi:hypothetical protein
MSRGLGKLQVVIKEVLTRAFQADAGPLRFTDLRAVMVIEHGGNPEHGDKLRPSVERSLKRALKTLVDRGDVLIFGGEGGVGDPYRYITVESFAGTALGGQDKVKDTAHAKSVLAKLQDAVTKATERGGVAAAVAKAKRSTAKPGRARHHPPKRKAAKAKRAKRRRGVR